MFLGRHTHTPNGFCGSIARQGFAPRVCVCPGPFPVPASASRIPEGKARSPGPNGTRRRFWEGRNRNWERSRAAQVPEAAAGRCGLAVTAVPQAEAQALVRKGKKILTPFLSPFSPLCQSRMSPPPFKPRFSMTSFDEILQHRNLRPSSAQDFFFSCRVFWQDPVPAIQIGPSDNKLRALPLRHNRFPQRSSKYLRVFISPLRDG